MQAWMLKNKIRKRMKKKSGDKTFLNLKNIHTILILFDTENYGEVDIFIKQLKRMGKKVTAYAFKSKTDAHDYSETPYKVITHKEAYAWFDKKIEEMADEIKAIQHDALFDMTIRKNIALQFFYINADATIKVGYKKDNFFQYDLSFSALNVKDNHENLRVRELGKQMIHYLSTIKS
jgi:hypothetical protein